MVKTMLCDGSFACFDMLMCTIPAVVLSVISLLLNGVMFVVGVTIARKQLDIFFASVIMSAVNSYLVMLLMGLLPLVTEWRRIRCSRGKKIGYLFTFPFFVFTFGIAMVLAVFGNIEWKPIKPVSYTHLDVYKRQVAVQVYQVHAALLGQVHQGLGVVGVVIADKGEVLHSVIAQELALLEGLLQLVLGGFGLAVGNPGPTGIGCFHGYSS